MKTPAGTIQRANPVRNYSHSSVRSSSSPGGITLIEIIRLFKIKNKVRFEHIFNILKLIATEITNNVMSRNNYMKAILDLLERDQIINFKMKLLFLKKMIDNKDKPVNELKLKHMNYNRINRYINIQAEDLNRFYNKRNKNNFRFKLEQEKTKEIIENITNFYNKVYKLLNKNKLTRMNYNNLVSNVIPYIAKEHQLQRLYNNIIKNPEYYKNKFKKRETPKRKRSGNIRNYMIKKN